MPDVLGDPHTVPLQVFTTAASLLELLDKSVMLSMRDGRVLYGIIRSFDTFGNVVIQDTMERIFFGDGTYAEQPRGLWIVRGENIAMIGQLDSDSSSEAVLSTLTPVPFEEAEARLEAENAGRTQNFEALRELSLQAGLEPVPSDRVPQLS